MPKTKKEICQLFRANELRTQRRFEEAIKIYTQLAQEGSENAELLAVIGECYYEFASVARNADECNLKAIQWLERAVAMAPNDASLHARLALLYWLAVLDYEHSASEFRIAIELNPNNPDTLLGAAGSYGEPSSAVSLEEALRWLEMAIRIDPNNPQYYLRLGDLYDSAGQTENAEQAWTKALLCTKAVDVMFTRGLEWKLCGGRWARAGRSALSAWTRTPR
ncbi:MAG: hypothetical protein DLM69_07775 [Candidatus Chloroheliales bacterium]|nr:MAG: hypothetical protein DLM69_07775 [Chloroflexota bacterium]